MKIRKENGKLNKAQVLLLSVVFAYILGVLIVNTVIAFSILGGTYNDSSVSTVIAKEEMDITQPLYVNDVDLIFGDDYCKVEKMSTAWASRYENVCVVHLSDGTDVTAPCKINVTANPSILVPYWEVYLKGDRTYEVEVYVPSVRG